MSPRWYRADEVRELVLEYYVVLRWLLRTKPRLRSCLKRCRHCRIFFLTDPRNRGRTGLGCPFGCRAAHRRNGSTERSVAYNRSPAGKLKKKLYNGKRGSGCRVPPEPEGEPAQESAGLERMEFDAGVVAYIGVVTGLIEGRRVGREEILAMLRLAMRQHSLVRERRIDYVVRRLKEQPP